MLPRLVLVVDDEPSIAITLRMILEDEGFRVAVAHNGLEALRLLAHERPALVITDVMMPVMGGVELCRRIQDDPDLRSIPVMATSAVKPPELDGLASRFLAKPWELDALLELVAELAWDPLPQAPAGWSPG